MNGYQKQAAGVFLIIVSFIWLFFSAIWMPPLAFASAYIGLSPVLIKLLLYADFVLPLCLVVYGFYLSLRKISN